MNGRARPGSLTVVCVVAWVLGLLALFGGIMSIMNVLGVAAANPFASLGQTPELAEMQEALQAEVLAVTQGWSTWLVWQSSFSILLATALGIGGAWCFKMRSPGRQLLMGAFAFGIVLHLASLYPTMSIQIETLQVVETIPDKMEQLGGMPPKARRIMESTMTIAGAVGLVMAIAMLLGQVGFFGYGIFFLRKPANVALFRDPRQLDPAATPE